MPGNGNGQSPSILPILDIMKLQKIKVIVDRIKTKQTWKASGGSWCRLWCSFGQCIVMAKEVRLLTNNQQKKHQSDTTG
jgi:hypothetical protein